MGFMKTGDAEILNVIEGDEDLNDAQTKKALDKVTKSLSTSEQNDGNKNELGKTDSESN